jgi:hypothetical protein
MNNVEIHINLVTGEDRRVAIDADQAFRFHAGFTRDDEGAGWKQVAAVDSGLPEDKILNVVRTCREAYLKDRA